MTLLILATGAPPRGAWAANETTLFSAASVLGSCLDHADFLLGFVVEELAGEPAENIIHDRLRHRDVGVLGESRGLEAHMAELVDQSPERHAVLQRDGNRRGEGVHQAGDGRAFLRHRDEDLAGLAVFIHSGGDVALVAGDIELVSDRAPLVGQLVAQRPASLLSAAAGFSLLCLSTCSAAGFASSHPGKSRSP